MKRCYRCSEHKDPTAFYRSSKYADGREASCKACQNIARSQRGRAQRAARRAERLAVRAQREEHERRRAAIRDGSCAYCQAGHHGPACEAAIFGPICSCPCGVLGYRDWSVPSGDFTAPAPIVRGVA